MKHNSIKTRPNITKRKIVETTVMFDPYLKGPEINPNGNESLTKVIKCEPSWRSLNMK
jgi:hypothetical protein